MSDQNPAAQMPSLVPVSSGSAESAPSLNVQGQPDGTPQEKPLAQSYAAKLTPEAKIDIAITETPVIPDEIGSAKWKESLPDDLKAEKSLTNLKTVEDLVRGYVNAQRMVGREKIAIPDPKLASDADYQAVFKKLGLPEDAKDYKVELAADAGLDSAFVDKMKVEAHKLGILPKQLEKLLTSYAGESKEFMKSFEVQRQAEHAQAHKDLQSEWGQAYQKNILAAQLAFKDAVSPEDQKYFQEKGLLTDTRIIKAFSKLGNILKEGELKGGNNGGQNVLAPAQAKQEAERIMSDIKGPYHDAAHANHGAAIAEVQRLMAMAYPEAPKES